MLWVLLAFRFATSSSIFTKFCVNVLLLERALMSQILISYVQWYVECANFWGDMEISVTE